MIRGLGGFEAELLSTDIVDSNEFTQPKKFQSFPAVIVRDHLSQIISHQTMSISSLFLQTERESRNRTRVLPKGTSNENVS